LNLLLSKRSIDEQKAFCLASAEMRELFCHNDIGLDLHQDISTMHTALCAAIEQRQLAPIMAVFAIVEFDTALPVPPLRVGGVCYDLCTLVLDIVHPATHSIHNKRHQDNDSNIACIRHVTQAGATTWNILKKDGAHMAWHSIQNSALDEEVNNTMYQTSMLLY